MNIYVAHSSKSSEKYFAPFLDLWDDEWKIINICVSITPCSFILLYSVLLSCFKFLRVLIVWLGSISLYIYMMRSCICFQVKLFINFLLVFQSVYRLEKNSFQEQRPYHSVHFKYSDYCQIIVSLIGSIMAKTV